MNIQNIIALAAQLKAVGFDNMGYPILKQVCLAPANFSLTEKLPKVPENILFTFHFEKQEKGESYKLLYYDAVLQQKLSVDNLSIEGVNVQDIDESMTKIDWKDVFDFSLLKPFNPDEKSSFETEVKVAGIVENLNRLERTDEGKSISIALKQKHWSGIPHLDIMGITTNGRSKSEISQRFYFSESQPVISADEVHRFLLNRWMEKQMQLKKKHQYNGSENESEDSSGVHGSGLLKKRRIGSNKKHKSANT